MENSSILDAILDPEPGPKIVCYLNLVDKRHDLLWQAMSNFGVNALVVSPAGNPKACASARGWGVEVVEHPVGIEKLMPDCTAVVGHGGMGLTSLSLARGKPLLLLPEHMEQFILAQRLFRRDLASGTIRLRKKEKIQSLVENLFTKDLESRARISFAARHSAYAPQHGVDEVVCAVLAST